MCTRILKGAVTIFDATSHLFWASWYVRHGGEAFMEIATGKGTLRSLFLVARLGVAVRLNLLGSVSSMSHLSRMCDLTYLAISLPTAIKSYCDHKGYHKGDHGGA